MQFFKGIKCFLPLPGTFFSFQNLMSRVRRKRRRRRKGRSGWEMEEEEEEDQREAVAFHLA